MRARERSCRKLRPARPQDPPRARLMSGAAIFSPVMILSARPFRMAWSRAATTAQAVSANSTAIDLGPAAILPSRQIDLHGFTLRRQTEAGLAPVPVETQ